MGQYVANDLRMRVYHHLDRLSLGYYDTQQTGNLLSTITTDISTIQNFASGATLGILVDLLTIVGMLGLMFWLNFDFALIAVGVTPFLLLFVMRFKKAVKKATHEVRHRQSDIVAVVQQGLESMRVVKAYGRQELEEEHLKEASQAAVEAALKARRIKSLLSPVVTVVVSLCTAFVLWRGASLILRGRDDDRRADGLPLVPEQVLQAGAGPGQDDQHHRAGGRRRRARPGDPRRRHDHPGAARRARARGASRARSPSRRWPSPTSPTPRS